MADTTDRRWHAPFVSLAAIWGASFLFIKVAVVDLPPLLVALTRCALGAAVLLAVLAVRREALPREPRVWGHLAVVALLANALPFTLFAAGERHISSVLAGLWNATTPLFTLAVVTLALPEERPTPARVAGLLVGFAGVVVVLGPWRAAGGAELAGQLMCLGATLGYGLAFPYLRRTLSGRSESALSLSAGQLLCATGLLAVVAPFAGGPTGSGLDTVGAMLGLGVLGTGLAYVLNFTIIRRAGATIASTVTYVIPLFSTALGIVVLGERPAWDQALGAIVVLLGVACSQAPPGSVSRRGRSARQKRDVGRRHRRRAGLRAARARQRPR
jgi:drug/metabolite transporter (DMT)-like permease